MSKYLDSYLKNEIKVLNCIKIPDLEHIISVLEHKRKQKSSIFICGNGGSATTASHFTCDLNNLEKFKDGIKFKCFCLNDNIAQLTATANDIGYNKIFTRALSNRASSDDILILLSASGDSENIVDVAEYARDSEIYTISISGFDGGRVAKITDLSVIIPIDNILIVEDIHLVINHMIANYFNRI
ncbi:D-sedoheptulose-7-phosphate isomerase [[Clostridium] innocuum]|uniref:D-sedoheptulose-7-phosphate isomerase n=1 Tax=Clostridium innocuum TaxID=1522 RepID=UPI001AF5BC81|nr:SIS domain-containing protein [[Clostridium] innocuum]QSI26387.1 SIS domain-containing protein [Erysipelotrichaceae bacterium 66202529]MCC2834161.1 SIS domain-containing protein [[Clostridium] innocuum]MCR0245720.1 SIS domain-containing protein [[Clostridium] innocuum]MCR0261426.1 SIS domain-containing protein [[Clostridium] innocuum]MCR0505663.1 SIS domain-containing protein [[Clostridium] innocuum]